MRGCKRELMSWVAAWAASGALGLAAWAASGALGLAAVPAEGAPGDPVQRAGSDPPFAACPEGTEAKVQSIELVGEEIRWCERTDPARGAVRHGPYRRTREGTVVDSGAYEDGLRTGSWTHVSGSGVKQEGEYREDRRVGIWVTRAADGEEVQRRDYGAAEPAGSPVASGADPSAPTPASAAWTLRVENDRTGDVELALEPAGESFLLPAGSSMELRASGVGPGAITIETSDEAITLRAQRGAELAPTPEAD